MNKQEYYVSRNRGRHLAEYKYVHKLLKQWKADNNYTCKCIIHHRDDTEECRKYNEEHYERWGCNEDGTFEYGKYVVFMTTAEHMQYHNAGEKHYMFGKHHTEAHKHSVSESLQGRRPWNFGLCQSKESNDKRRCTCTENIKGVKVLYTVYKAHGGKLLWNEFQRALKTGEITFEMQSISVYTNGGR